MHPILPKKAETAQNRRNQGLSPNKFKIKPQGGYNRRNTWKRVSFCHAKARQFKSLMEETEMPGKIIENVEEFYIWMENLLERDKIPRAKTWLKAK